MLALNLIKASNIPENESKLLFSETLLKVMKNVWLKKNMWRLKVNFKSNREEDLDSYR